VVPPPADIGLQDIDGTGGEHGPKVVEVVAVFACEAAQARPVVGADRLID